MRPEERERLLNRCLAHLHEETLLPVPTSRAELLAAKEAVSNEAPDKDALRAWYRLYDMSTSADPAPAWSLLLELIARCSAQERSIVAAGPLGAFLHNHANSFADAIKEELSQNAAFRDAFHWTRHYELNGEPE